jgi:uncharacterized protein YbjT (DUF2867 family)
MNILVTGASGYIGGRLIPRLVAEGHHVICLVRNPERLRLSTRDSVEIRLGDLLDPASLQHATKNIDAAYYLVHSMADGVQGYIERDQQAAFNFGQAAKEAGIQRIIYLGGLGATDKSISPHLEARQQVGEVLRDSGVPVTEFRAAIVIGSGSMSFEMIRYLTERSPILPTPKWISTLCQPIAIDNVLDYLILSLTEPKSNGATFEIGGPDVFTYEDIMRGYAAARHLNRKLVKIPFLTTKMLAIGADILTPLPAPYLQILIEGLRSEVVVNNPSAQEVFKVKLISYNQAVQCALDRPGSGEIEAYWAGGQEGLKPGKRRKIIEGMYIEQRRVAADVTPEAVFSIFTSIGGKRGWYYADWLWQVRGWLDRLAGGVGMHRGRRSQGELQAGDMVDGYTVEAIETGHMMRLRNDMKAPGPAWMQFEAQKKDSEKTLFIQTAFFEPHGLAGMAYWYALYPFHQLIFDGLARAIIQRAETMRERDISVLTSE